MIKFAPTIRGRCSWLFSRTVGHSYRMGLKVNDRFETKWPLASAGPPAGGRWHHCHHSIALDSRVKFIRAGLTFTFYESMICKVTNAPSEPMTSIKQQGICISSLPTSHSLKLTLYKRPWVKSCQVEGSNKYRFTNCEMVGFYRHIKPCELFDAKSCSYYHIYPTPPLGQDMTQGQFLCGV